MCPHCLSRHARKKTHLRWHDWPLLAIGVKPKRCAHCFRRFYAWPWFRDY